MKIYSSLKSGFLRTLNAGKSILIVWFCIFILVLVFVFPLRRSLTSAFGDSMITEKLADGINIEAFTDLGPVFKNIMSFLTAGLMFTFLAGFLLNSFLTAGLFGSVKNDSMKFSPSEFFSAGALNFKAFLLISLLITLIIDFGFILIVVAPAAIVSLSETASDKSLFMILFITGVVFLLVIPLMLLVADYSRAYKTSDPAVSAFSAIGKGFSLAFSGFRRSYMMMLLLIVAQIMLGVIIVLLLPAWRPVTGGGVFLLLIVSQLLFILRLFLKTWRYASVSSMMNEITAEKVKDYVKIDVNQTETVLPPATEGV
ncbi:MAG TPA: hypothetical protein PLX08_08405 [Bacteroidales bacterium]|mgnify:CR=1 FL=1|jgi:hypothetical protein|nr:hypothetical protein [Bacteroidales bacterium]